MAFRLAGKKVRLKVEMMAVGKENLRVVLMVIWLEQYLVVL